jgi:hypothetical protein
MSEQPVSELTKALGVLTERLEGLRQTVTTPPALRPPPGRHAEAQHLGTRPASGHRPAAGQDRLLALTPVRHSKKEERTR